MSEWIKYAGQLIDDEDIEAVTSVLRSDYLSQGPKIEEFEQKLAAFAGARYCVVVASGTAALHLAVMALNLPGGQGGITSVNTFFASANALVYNGLEPGFADIEEDTYCMSFSSLEKGIDENSGVVVPVHFAGHPADMPALSDIAKKNNAFVIEDAAHALGSLCEDGSRVGACTHSHMTVFSFQPLKTITTGEGGAITTNDHTFHDRLRQLRNHGITKDPVKFRIQDPKGDRPWYHEVQELGFNYRMTDFQAALGISQLGKIEAFIRKRRNIVKRYNEGFGNLDWLTVPVEKPGNSAAYHLYVVQMDFDCLGKTRSEVMERLRVRKIQTQVHYIPVHLQPYYREKYGYGEGDFPVAEKYYSRCLTLPLHAGMSEDDVQRVIDAVHSLDD